MRAILVVIAFLVASGIPQRGRAADDAAYPNRPVRLIVPYAAGGSADLLARILASKLATTMGQPWVVENRLGAGGNIGAELVARASPDGYTVLMAVDSTLTVNPSFYKMPFSVSDDLDPVTLLAWTEMMVVIHPSVKANNLKEFVALAKREPGTLNYASGGVGNQAHLATELLAKRVGVEMVHVPYKNGGPAAAAAMLGGETQVYLGTVASTMGYVQSGQLRALATTGAKRSKLMPGLPTVAESGYPGFEAGIWFALLVPSKTPAPIVTRIRDGALLALRQTDVVDALARQGLEPITSTPQELRSRIERETTMWADLIKTQGIHPQ